MSDAAADTGPIDPGEMDAHVNLGDDGDEGEQSPFAEQAEAGEGERWWENEGEGEPEAEASEDPEAEPVEAAEAEADAEPEPEAEPEPDKEPEAAEDKSEDALHTVKVDGEERQVTLSELLDSYERSTASYKRFEEASNLRKSFEQQIAQLKDRPDALWDVIKQFGHDPQQLAEQYLIDHVITPNELPEHARKQLEQERQLREELERQTRERQQAEAKAQQEKQRMQFQQETVPAIKSALAEQQIPFNDGTMRHVLHEMDKALVSGVELSPKEAVELVSEHWSGGFRERLSSMDAPSILKELGPEKAKAIREHLASEVKQAKSKSRPKATGSGKSRRSSGPITMEELDAQLRKRVGVR